MRAHLVILTAIALLARSPFDNAAADIAPNPMTGGSAICAPDTVATNVRMANEDVVVRIFRDSIATTASFSMHNEGEKVDMEVGFPFRYPNDLVAFRAFVNGLPVSIHDGRKEQLTRNKKVVVYWKLWNMTFQRGERCSIRVEYTTKPVRMVRMGIQARGSMDVDTVAAVQSATTTGEVEYWLETGRPWKGVLDRCTVSFELVDFSGNRVWDVYPKDGVVGENRVTWEYTDYEPAGRVALSYFQNMSMQEISPFLRGLLERHPKDAGFANVAGGFLASCFGPEVKEDVYHSFLSRWDEPIPQIMEYAPGGRCRFSFRTAGEFYQAVSMASSLFSDYGRTGELEKGKDIAPIVSRMMQALVDSLETCELPERDVALLQQAKKLLATSNALIETPR